MTLAMEYRNVANATLGVSEARFAELQLDPPVISLTEALSRAAL